MNTIPCTVEILTRNSGRTLRRALESVRDFREIILVDGQSTDDTRAIAAEFGARILEQSPEYVAPDGSILDFSGVRNQGFSAASQPWFFFLDSDEYLSPELVEEIRRVAVEERVGAYRVLRKYVLRDVVIQHAASYPNRSLRLFARDSAKGFIKRIHERIQLKETIVPGNISAPLYVPVNPDPKASKRKERYYISLQVDQARPVTFAHAAYVAVRTARSMIRRILAIVWNTLTLRPNRLPMALEAEAVRYDLALIGTFIREAFARKSH